MATVKAIRPKTGKIFDINIISTHDFRLLAKSMRTRGFLKYIVKGISKSLIICKKQSQKNITSMNAVLSGWMRNNWKSIVKINSDSINGVMWNDSWYAYMVHQGLNIHAKPPQGKFISSELTPADIASLQKKRMKNKKKKTKGRRPFFIKAFDDKKQEMFNILGKESIEGLKKLAMKSARRTKIE